MASGKLFTLDRDRCIGSGLCVLYAPATFEHDEQAKVIVLDPPGDDEEMIRTAVEACPTKALKLVGHEGDN